MLCLFHFELKLNLRKGRIPEGQVFIEKGQIPQKSREGCRLRCHQTWQVGGPFRRSVLVARLLWVAIGGPVQGLKGVLKHFVG